MTTSTRAGRLPALILTLVTVAIAAVALTLGSGGGSSAAPSPTPATPATPARAAAPHAPERVPAAVTTTRAPSAHTGDSPAQMYLDDSDERRGRLIHAYDTCLLAHGATEDTSRAVAVFQGTGVRPITVAEPVPASASAACADRLPLLPEEENPGLNPDYAADSAANVACLRDHGIAVHTIADHSVYPDGLSWTYDNDHVVTPDDEARIEQDCLVASFGD